jgi:hypothetical protein
MFRMRTIYFRVKIAKFVVPMCHQVMKYTSRSNKLITLSPLFYA